MTPTCPRDGQPYQFDVETYRLSVEQTGGVGPIYRWACPLGHAWPFPISGASLGD